MIRFLCWLKSKLNSVKSLVSQALIDTNISNEEFITIMKEKKKMKKMRENVTNANEKLEQINKIMRPNSLNSKT